jgi:hypothetical protein
MASRVNHQETVKRLLDTKVVDFAAVGKAVAELGPSLSLADEPWEGFCGTMRHFIRIYVVNPSAGVTNVENLGRLRSAAAELQS